MTKFSNKLKKNLYDPFWAHFSNFLRTLFGIPASCQNLEKINDTIIPRKCPDRQEGKMDGRANRPYFIGPFWLASGVQ